jgi:hypothetical protein
MEEGHSSTFFFFQWFALLTAAAVAALGEAAAMLVLCPTLAFLFFGSVISDDPQLGARN